MNTCYKSNINTLSYVLLLHIIKGSMRYTIAQFNKGLPNDDVCLDASSKTATARSRPARSAGLSAQQSSTALPTASAMPACTVAAGCTRWHRPSSTSPTYRSRAGSTLSACFSVSKNGVSAKELERHAGVTYKTAHRMARQIRLLMEQDGDSLSGEIDEVDETFIGGRRKLLQKFNNKSIVLGMVERNGGAKAIHVKSSGVRVLLAEIQRCDT